MRNWLCALLAVIALAVAGCLTTGATPAVPWPEGWPITAFPKPIPGAKAALILQNSGVGLRQDGVLFESPYVVADAERWLEAEAIKAGLLALHATDTERAEVGKSFGVPLSVSQLWTRQDGEKALTLALGTLESQAVVLYVVQESSNSPRPLPADWPSDVVIPANTEVVGLIHDLKRNARSAVLNTNSPMYEVQTLLDTTLYERGFVSTGKNVWKKGQVIESVVGGSEKNAVLLIHY